MSSRIERVLLQQNQQLADYVKKLNEKIETLSTQITELETAFVQYKSSEQTKPVPQENTQPPTPVVHSTEAWNPTSRTLDLNSVVTNTESLPVNTQQNSEEWFEK